MVLSATVPIINGGINIRAKSGFHHSAIRKFEYGRTQNTDLASWKTKSQAIRVLANPNASPQRERTKKEVIMVDPLEAKRLAAKQMEEIKAKERLQRRRQIEAINGAWAMIGLTAGLIIEGHTGLSIPSQVLYQILLHFGGSNTVKQLFWRVEQHKQLHINEVLT